MATHICGGIPMLSEITFGSKNLDCGMELENTHEGYHDQNPNQTILKGPKCCDNHYQSIETDDITVPSKVSLDSYNYVFITSFLVAFSPEVITSDDLNSNLRKPFLPPVINDLTVMHEAFLL
ncbi:hypothetical protein OO013_08520 [Mangrovivirga sp. M17]|uniref:Uncharacterized protein n=1 Tax=Mangrovivirga halotolerans TaxID=2993936 RepID=A0ABT3RQQ5_9BACT|nr:hypothetical protein [Mangrovivirga halotolerans]MCX2743907.1 hypothetical protein [Mangrovivirga halotolerans]